MTRTPDELRDEAARQGRLCQEAWTRRDYEAAKRHLARARELTLEAAKAETPPDLMDGAPFL